MAGSGLLAWNLKQAIRPQAPIGLPSSDAPCAWQASSKAMSSFSRAKSQMWSMSAGRPK